MTRLGNAFQVGARRSRSGLRLLLDWYANPLGLLYLIVLGAGVAVAWLTDNTFVSLVLATLVLAGLIPLRVNALRRDVNNVQARARRRTDRAIADVRDFAVRERRSFLKSVEAARQEFTHLLGSERTLWEDANDATRSQMVEFERQAERRNDAILEIQGRLERLQEAVSNLSSAAESHAQIPQLEERQLHFERRLAEQKNLIASLEAATNSLESRLEELRSVPSTVEYDDTELRRWVNRRLSTERSGTSLRLARIEARYQDPDGVVLIVAPQRSGSTLLLDLVRAHPGAVFLARADVYRALNVGGRRYPAHLTADNGVPALDIEIQDGVGGLVPSFQDEKESLDGSSPGCERSWAVEKVHPSAIEFDVPAFVDRLDRYEKSRPLGVRLVYLVRDPMSSIRSFLAYQQRDSRWHSEAPLRSVPDLYLQSYRTIRDMLCARPGPVITYDDLIQDPAAIALELYESLWPEISTDRAATYAARITAHTSRDAVLQRQAGPFVGTVDEKVPSPSEFLVGAVEGVDPGVIERCRQVYGEILRQGRLNSTADSL